MSDKEALKEGLKEASKEGLGKESNSKKTESKNFHLPWTVKYAPTSTAELSAQRSALDQLRGFVKNHKEGQVALLYGPQGSGKTTMVHLLAKELELEILELNASDVRNESSIRETLGPALVNRSLFSSGKIILFDEVDGLSGSKDRGGLSALLDLAKTTSYPVIMTANDPWDQKFNDLRKKSLMIPVRGLAYTSILPVLKKLAEAESVEFDDTALQSLARRAGGDIRAAITDLQTLKEVSAESVEAVSARDVTGNIIDAVRVVLKTRDPKTARLMLDNLSEDVDQIFLWMDENMPKEYRKPEDLLRGYEALATADRFRGRIRRWQHWRFLVYCYGLLGPGIALAKKDKYDGFIQIAPTKRIFAIWRARSAMRDRVVAKLALEQHTSQRRARQEMRILRPVLANSAFLDEEEQDWLIDASKASRTVRKKASAKTVRPIKQKS